MKLSTRYEDIRNPQEYAEAVAYFHQLNQSSEAQAHTEEINVLGELLETHEILNGLLPDEDQ